MINMQTICMYISYQGGVYLQTIYLNIYIYIYQTIYLNKYFIYKQYISCNIYYNVSFEFLLSLLYHMLPYITLNYEIIMFFFSN